MLNYRVEKTDHHEETDQLSENLAEVRLLHGQRDERPYQLDERKRPQQRESVAL